VLKPAHQHRDAAHHEEHGLRVECIVGFTETEAPIPIGEVDLETRSWQTAGSRGSRAWCCARP